VVLPKYLALYECIGETGLSGTTLIFRHKGKHWTKGRQGSIEWKKGRCRPISTDIGPSRERGPKGFVNPSTNLIIWFKRSKKETSWHDWFRWIKRCYRTNSALEDQLDYITYIIQLLMSNYQIGLCFFSLNNSQLDALF
jgi:hypothetical protein